MRQKGALVGDGPNRQVLGSDGNWYSINQTDMGHVTAAVDYWNAAGRYYGPRSPEVRNFMRDPENYWLEPSGINRSNGASMGKPICIQLVKLKEINSSESMTLNRISK